MALAVSESALAAIVEAVDMLVSQKFDNMKNCLHDEVASLRKELHEVKEKQKMERETLDKLARNTKEGFESTKNEIMEELRIFRGLWRVQDYAVNETKAVSEYVNSATVDGPKLVEEKAGDMVIVLKDSEEAVDATWAKEEQNVGKERKEPGQGVEVEKVLAEKEGAQEVVENRREEVDQPAEEGSEFRNGLSSENSEAVTEKERPEDENEDTKECVGEKEVASAENEASGEAPAAAKTVQEAAGDGDGGTVTPAVDPSVRTPASSDDSVSKDARVAGSDKCSLTPFRLAAATVKEACDAGAADDVRRLLELGWDMEGGDARCRTPLHWAAMLGRARVVAALLEWGADAGAKDTGGRTPLHCAAAAGHAEVVATLLGARTKVNGTGTACGTPLSDAADAGHLEVVRILRRYGFSLLSGKQEGLQALERAAAAGRESVVLALVEETPLEGLAEALLAAAEEGLAAACGVLAAAGVPLDTKDTESSTPLHKCAAAGHVRCLRALVDLGAFLEEKDAAGNTPLHVAILSKRPKCVRILLRAGASKETNGKEGRRPLHAAASVGSVECVSALLDSGVSVNACSSAGYTSLHLAAQGGHIDVVQELIQGGADIDPALDVVFSPLYIASNRGHIKIVEYLIQAGANIESCNVNGHRPLHTAVYNDKEDVVRALLKAGADPQAKDKQGKMPLDFAKSNNMHKLFQK